MKGEKLSEIIEKEARKSWCVLETPLGLSTSIPTKDLIKDAKNWPGEYLVEVEFKDKVKYLYVLNTLTMGFIRIRLTPKRDQ